MCRAYSKMEAWNGWRINMFTRRRPNQSIKAAFQCVAMCVHVWMCCHDLDSPWSTDFEKHRLLSETFRSRSRSIMFAGFSSFDSCFCSRCMYNVDLSVWSWWLWFLNRSDWEHGLDKICQCISTINLIHRAHAQAWTPVHENAFCAQIYIYIIIESRSRSYRRKTIEHC